MLIVLPQMVGADVTDRMDANMLIGLTGDQECACCGNKPLRPEDVDVMDGEVTCLDCMGTYYPTAYERRTENA